MTSYLRPDERANQSQIERAGKFDKRLKSGLKTAGKIVTGGAAIGLAGKIAPFLSQYIPTDLAIKGISKVSPKMGDILQKGVASGLSAKEGLQFIKNKFFPEKEKEQNSQQQMNPPQEEEGVESGIDPHLAQMLQQGNQILQKVRGR